MPVRFELQSKVPVKVWAEPHQVGSEAMEQLKRTASLPFVFKWVAAMPDVHLGKGATVGSVVATKGAVIPAAVGVDIGCGMMAVRTRLEEGPVRDRLKEIRAAIENRIPVGFNKHKSALPSAGKWEGWRTFQDLAEHRDDLRDRARKQLGTLGGGNHFIEICLDEQSRVWVMLHSGSRYVGKTLADVHISKAKGVIKQMAVSLPDRDLAYFAQGTPEYKAYMHDLLWCQAYAKRNREEMMRAILDEIASLFGASLPGATFPGGGKLPGDGKTIPIDLEVNCHHNYAEMEEHFGEQVLVTRKGAVRARQGDLGIIPGSMGARSFIVEGLGNPDSFHSCSHGAGRRMSRTQAKKEFTLHDLAAQTEGVECRKDRGVLDEIPGAYKDIGEVMDNQSDLVRVVATLKQILCVKG